MHTNEFVLNKRTCVKVIKLIFEQGQQQLVIKNSVIVSYTDDQRMLFH